MNKEKINKNELAAWNSKHGDEPKPFDRFDQLLIDNMEPEMSLEEMLNLETKDMKSFTLHEDKIEITSNEGFSSFLYFGNKTNVYLAQLIKNKYSDKEVKC